MGRLADSGLLTGKLADVTIFWLLLGGIWADLGAWDDDAVWID